MVPIEVPIHKYFSEPQNYNLELRSWKAASFYPSYHLLKGPQKIKIIIPYKGTIGIIIIYFWGTLKQIVASYQRSAVCLQLSAICPSHSESEQRVSR